MGNDKMRTRIDDIDVDGPELQDHDLRLVSGGLPAESHVWTCSNPNGSGCGGEWTEGWDAGF